MREETAFALQRKLSSIDEEIAELNDTIGQNRRHLEDLEQQLRRAQEQRAAISNDLHEAGHKREFLGAGDGCGRPLYPEDGGSTYCGSPKTEALCDRCRTEQASTKERPTRPNPTEAEQRG